MTKRIAKAYATYESTIAPQAIKRVLALAKRNRLITAASIRAGALATLHAAIEKELAR